MKTNAVDYEKMERMRAFWIIDKAEREGLNVTDTLVHHMVSATLIKELTGREVDRSRKTKSDPRAKLHEWVVLNIGKEITANELAEAFKFSLATAHKMLRDNIDYFTKVKRGIYVVRDGKAEREAAKRDK